MSRVTLFQVFTQVVFHRRLSVFEAFVKVCSQEYQINNIKCSLTLSFWGGLHLQFYKLFLVSFIDDKFGCSPTSGCSNILTFSVFWGHLLLEVFIIWCYINITLVPLLPISIFNSLVVGSGFLRERFFFK